ncbi:Cytochrome P450 71B37 [Nymphaea thermarum]|nr:Cytochrome P450 71B37 [Nymphaea thermarum]
MYSSTLGQSLKRLNVVLGGSDTSSAPVVWAMVELMRRPQLMNRVQDELRHKIKGKAKSMLCKPLLVKSYQKV